MVRFIIDYLILFDIEIDSFTFQYGQIYYVYRVFQKVPQAAIYIPIWLDLLSNISPTPSVLFVLFTFQYGQIYYMVIYLFLMKIVLIYIPIWLDLLFQIKILTRITLGNLHSNMVRFIIDDNSIIQIAKSQFTFQYGQIYYITKSKSSNKRRYIYIPIWLDLLFKEPVSRGESKAYLHSNMVRFIIREA